jgi:hypothetical protein
VRILLLISAFLFATGCSTYLKRKECEKVNWQDYGYNLAMKGVRPGEDGYVAECRKVEADMSEMHLDLGFKSGMDAYCKPDQAFLTGKSGQKLNLDFCDPSKGKLLSAKHAEGIKAYCSPEGGFTEGSSGRIYTGICSQSAEPFFMKEYRRGRKKYVEVVIAENRALISEKESKIAGIRRDNDQLTLRLALLPRPRTVVERVYDPATQQLKENVRTEDPFAHERQHLRSAMDSNRYRIEEEERAQARLRETITKYQTELASLDN